MLFSKNYLLFNVDYIIKGLRRILRQQITANNHFKILTQKKGKPYIATLFQAML